MPTFGDAIDRVFRWADQRGRVDTLDTAMLTGSQLAEVTITPSDISLWGAPTDVEIGSEIFHVTSVDRSAGTATAIRGWRDSTPASHSVGDVCLVSPRFFRMDAKDAILDALRRMVPPLWKHTATNITFSSDTVGYELPAACIDVYRIWNEVNTSTNRWKEIHSFDVAQKMDTTGDFTTGKALILMEPCAPGTLRVEYKAKFTEPTAESDDMQTTVGLEDFMLDIPVWYAVSVLLPPDEVLRSQVTSAVSQARAEAVQPRQNVAAADYFRTRFEDALQDASERMELIYPTRLRVVR